MSSNAHIPESEMPSPTYSPVEKRNILKEFRRLLGLGLPNPNPNPQMEILDPSQEPNQNQH